MHRVPHNEQDGYSACIALCGRNPVGHPSSKHTRTARCIVQFVELDPGPIIFVSG